MKVTIEFNLKNEDDVIAHDLHLDARDLANVVYNVASQLRSWLKYDILNAENYREKFEQLQQAVYQGLSATRGDYV